MNPFLQEVLNLSTQALILSFSTMLLFWLMHFAVRNASMAHLGWVAAVGLCALLYCYQGSGTVPRKFLLAIMVAIWAVRLFLHLLFNRVVGQREDGRYQNLRRSYGKGPALKYLTFFVSFAVCAVVISLPILLASLDGFPDLRASEKFAALLWLFAVSGETVADMQLNRFRSAAGNRGKVCREGLWGWSRHPNYLFEFLVWLSFAIYALPAKWGFAALISPALLLYFLLRVTGIPPAEEQAIRSKGEAYRDYQRDTGAFWPSGSRTER